MHLITTEPVDLKVRKHSPPTQPEAKLMWSQSELCDTSYTIFIYLVNGYFLFFINHFIHLHFNLYPPSWLPLHNPPIPSPLSLFPFVSMRMLLHPLSRLTILVYSYTGHQASTGSRASPPIAVKGGHLLHTYLEPWLPPRIYSSVGSLVPGNSGWSSELILFFLMGLQAPSAPSVLLLALPLGSPGSVLGLAISVCICIGQVLVEPFNTKPSVHLIVEFWRHDFVSCKKYIINIFIFPQIKVSDGLLNGVFTYFSVFLPKISGSSMSVSIIILILTEVHI